MKYLTAEQVVKKYKNKYIQVKRIFDCEKSNFGKPVYMYQVFKSYKNIHENTCLVLDVDFYDKWLS